MIFQILNILMFLHLFLDGVINNNTWKQEAIVESDRGSKRSASPPTVGSSKKARSRRPPASAPPPPPANSVLMNLLVSGCDVSAGYICLVQGRPRPPRT